MSMGVNFLYKCHAMDIRAHQKAGSKQFAQQPSTPAALDTVTVGAFLCVEAHVHM